MGLMLAEPGFHTRCFVELEEYPRSAIIAAQRAGYFAPAPIWTDLKTFDAKPLAGAIDTLIAGYPCQPFSMAGQRKGADDPRHLWPHVARVARELGDGLCWIFLENVSGHVTLGADAVLRELRGMGFTPAAGIFSAEEVDAPHERQRWFCVAHREGRGRGIGGDAAQPGGGSDGGRVVDDARCAERRQSIEAGNVSDGSAPGWIEGTSRSEQSGDNVDNTTSPRCDATRIGAEADSQGRECLSGDGCDDMAQPASAGLSQRRQPGQPEAAMADANRCDGDGGRNRGQGWRAEPANRGLDLADASGARPQGREQPGSPDQRDRTPAHGSTAQCGSPWLFPPGPADAAAWEAILGSCPDLAPSFARRDVVAAAVNIAAVLSPDEAEEVESRLRSIPRGAGMASVVEQAPELVGKAQALTGLRNVADGLANRTRALRLLGNGVHPLAAAYAWRTLATAHGLGALDMAGAGSDNPARPTIPVRGGVK